MNLYVTKKGKNDAIGSKENPFDSIEAAKIKVRELVSKGLDEEVTVYVDEGIYYIDSLQFTKEDSGTAEHPVRYEAIGKVTLSGGTKLPYEHFKPISEEIGESLSEDARKNVVCIDLNELGITREQYGEMCAIGSHNSAHLYDDAVISPNGCELFVNDKRQIIARYPNEGYLTIVGAVREGEAAEPYKKVMDTSYEWVNRNEIWNKKRNPVSDIYRIDKETAQRAAAWNYKDELWMYSKPCYDWADMSSPVVSVDARTCAMETKYVSRYGILPEDYRDVYYNGGIYYLYNVLDELDVPGEWYLDRKNAILYLYPDCDLKTADITLSLSTEPILKFDGASNLSFVGFELLGSRAEAIAGICNDIVFDGLKIKNIAENAVNVSGLRNIVKNCEIHNCGAGGIRISGGDRATLTHGENIVENNRIHDFAKIRQTYQPGIYLNGCGNIVRHNEIFNTPHMALGYHGNEHLFEYNYIHDCTYASNDAGAIYSGYDWTCHGTVIRYNLIENIGDNGYRPDGIYWDDGLSGQTAYGNIIVGVVKFSVLLGGGHDNVFEENLIINSGEAAIRFDDRFRESFFTKGQFYDGIVYPTGKHWKNLERVPYKSELWKAKYPHIAMLKSDLETTPDDINFAPNPSYCSVAKNVIIAPRGNVCEVSESGKMFSQIEDNFVYPTFEAAGVDEKNYRIKADSPIFSDIPKFKSIPIEKIGLIK